MKKITQNDFEKRCIEIYGNRYSFDKTVYKNYKTKITVYDNKTNEYLNFYPGDLLSGKVKGKNKRFTTENVIKESKAIFGENNYDYSKTICKSSMDTITITCKHHGDFTKKAYVHIDMRQGCPLCSRNYRVKDELISMAKNIYGDVYDYSLVTDAGVHDTIKIICKKHGVFEKQVYDFLTRKSGCPKCSIEKSYKSVKDFVTDSNLDERGILLIGDYKNASTKTLFKCNKCGYVWESLPSKIQCGCGCPKCGGRIKPTLDEFIERSRIKHGEKYDYQLVDMNDATNTNNYHVNIVCKKHGVFSQSIYQHMNGVGCPICKESKMEMEIRKLLDDRKIKFEMYWKNDGMKNTLPLSLDFFLPEYNTAIECQGNFHFNIINALGGESAFEKQRENDLIKNRFCKENGIKLLYYTDLDYDNFLGEKLFKNKEELLEEIVHT